jgi:CheY-like chemotaxis protein/HPt (histidine-containing phosphotransfer) domain-containing protein
VLRELGYQVDVADDGVQALAMFGRRDYDAVLLDCQMPNMDGYETAGEIRRREAAAQADGEHGDADPPARTPIIAMTAAALKGDRDRCYAAGMDDYLSKPFEPDDLAAALHRWIGDEPPAAAGPAPHAVVDRDIVERLERLRGYVPPATIERFRTSFLSDGDRCIAALGAALGEADADGLAGAAHSLRGAASGIGATTLAGLCETLEDLATAGNLREAPAAFAGVQTAYAYAMDTLQEIAITDPGRGEAR